MPEENVVPQTEIVEEQPTQTPEVEATEQEVPTETQTEATEPTVDAPAEADVAPLQAEEPAEFPYYPPTQPVPDFEPDQDGFIDPKAFYQKVKADAVNELREEMKFQESERKAWNAVENKYPELKEDKELKDLLHSQRIADVAQGGRGDLNKVAERLFNKLNGYKTQGKVQAQVSEKVQKSAGLAKSTANRVENTGDNELIERMSRGDQGARDSLIEQWLNEGKL